MDEIFHVPQLRAYLKSWNQQHDHSLWNRIIITLFKTSWNEKITTFPGLYWFSLGYCALYTLIDLITQKIIDFYISWTSKGMGNIGDHKINVNLKYMIELKCEENLASIRFVNFTAAILIVILYIYRKHVSSIISFNLYNNVLFYKNKSLNYNNHNDINENNDNEYNESIESIENNGNNHFRENNENNKLYLSEGLRQRKIDLSELGESDSSSSTLKLINISNISNSNNLNTYNAENNKLSNRFQLEESFFERLQFISFPFFIFFSFMYYTDVISLLAFLYSFHYKSPLLALCCLLMRQSNIVNVFYLGWNLVYSDFIRFHWTQLKSLDESKFARNRPFFRELYLFVLYILKNFIKILRKYYLWISIGVSFLIFAWKNGSIVLGDKSNHEAIFHFNQLSYFVVFTCTMIPGHILTTIYELPSILRKRYIISTNSTNFTKPNNTTISNITIKSNNSTNSTNSTNTIKKSRSTNTFRLNLIQIIVDLILFVSMTILLAILNYKFAYVHPFILSDNRHYIFYLWRKLFHIQDMQSNMYRIRNALFSPIFSLCLIYLNYKLRYYSKLWRFLLLATVSMQIMIAPLVEFRYYIIPFYIVLEHIQYNERVHHPSRAKIASTINSIYYLLINGLTIYIFLFRPFGENNENRFMW